VVSTVAAPAVDEAAVRAALSDVADPEIPAISIVDLGIVERVDVADDAIRVDLLPTFVGCPALDAIGSAVEERLAGFGRPVEVRFGFSVPWTTDRITERGRRHLAKSGFAPPGDDTCPYCGSADVLTGQPVRPDPVPLDPLLPVVPPAVRGVQARLNEGRLPFSVLAPQANPAHRQACCSAIARAKGPNGVIGRWRRRTRRG
jgi:ring-1,2-phenylacetyl-CoA epoxidase subunit PaaD